MRNITAALVTMALGSSIATAEPKTVRMIGDCRTWSPDEIKGLGVRPWFVAEAIDKSGALFAMHGSGGKLVIGLTLGNEVCLFPFANLAVVEEREVQR